MSCDVCWRKATKREDPFGNDDKVVLCDIHYRQMIEWKEVWGTGKTKYDDYLTWRL